jgi:hypothetical protein
MNLTPKRIIRFIMGTLLPVPLFVSIYYFSYFYTSYHGFDHETKTYITGEQNVELARYYLKADAVVFLAAGYLLMGIPSLAYSFLLERYRTSSRFEIRRYVGWGALMGGVSGLIAACFQFVLTDGTYDSFLVVATSSAVGGIVPLLLLPVGPARSIQKDRENKSRMATPTSPSVIDASQ